MAENIHFSMTYTNVRHRYTYAYTGVCVYMLPEQNAFYTKFILIWPTHT